MKKHYLLLFPLVFSCSFSYGQLTVTPGTGVKVLRGTELSSSGVNVSDGGKVTVGGSLRITGGGLVNEGTTEISGQLAMEGGNAIGGSNPFNIGTLRINSPGGVEVSNELTIHDSMMMQHGNVYVDTSTPLHFGINALSPAERSGSYIEGRAIMDPRMVGGGSLPVFLGCAISGGADIGSVTIIRTNGPEGIVTQGAYTSIASNWAVISNRNPDIANRNITFYWLPEHDNGKDLGSIDLYGSLLGGKNFHKLNEASATVPGSGYRLFTQRRVGRFNQVFTLSDKSNPLAEPAIGQRIVSVFPNPFVETLTIDLENARNYPVVARFVDATGKIVYQGTHLPQNNRVVLSDLGYLPQGNYWLNLYIHGSTVSTHIIKIQ